MTEKLIAASNTRAAATTSGSWKTPLAVAVVCAVCLILATRGISSEASASFQGDMPRYLMNAAYFHDLLRDLPLRHPVEYTYAYYARYPALSLGFHPLLPGAVVTPFYWLFGISVFAGRMAIVCFVLVMVIAWFFLVRRVYDDTVALLAGLLLTTTPYVVKFSQVVMSEIPALALTMVAAYFLVRYCQSGTRRHIVIFAVVAALSAYAKHHCIFMFPVFFAYLLLTQGVRKLFTTDVILAGFLIVILCAPLVPITLKFSRTNVAWISTKDLGARFEANNILYYIEAAWRYHLTTPVLVLSGLGLAFSMYRRDRRILLFVLWIVLFYLQLSYTGTQVARYAIYWIPAFCLLAASLIATVPRRFWRAACVGVLLLVVVYQFAKAYAVEPEYAEGYEQAARYVVELRKGDSVLYAAEEDSGFFTFFVRKHDLHEGMIVLRADKVLGTSALYRVVEDRITGPEQIDQILRDFGIAYVVVEDKQARGGFTSRPLQWLLQVLDSDAFVVRERIPLRTNSRRLQDVQSLTIYEYKGYTPGQRVKTLQMNIPLMGGSVAVPLERLLSQQPVASDGAHP